MVDREHKRILVERMTSQGRLLYEILRRGIRERVKKGLGAILLVN